MIGLDLAKKVFQLHGIDASEAVGDYAICPADACQALAGARCR
jgi:hypothetical protein